MGPKPSRPARWPGRIALGCGGFTALLAVLIGGAFGLNAYWKWLEQRHLAQASSARCDAFKGAYRDGTLVGFGPPRHGKLDHRKPDSSRAISDRVAARRQKVLTALGLASAHPQLFVDQGDDFYDEAVIADRDAQGWSVTPLFNDWRTPRINKVGAPQRLSIEAGQKLDQLIGADCLYAEPQAVIDRPIFPSFPRDPRFHLIIDGPPPTYILVETPAHRFGAIHYPGLYGMTGGVARLLWQESGYSWKFHADPYEAARADEPSADAPAHF